MNKFLILCFGCLLFSCVLKEAKLIKNQKLGDAFGTSYSIIYLIESKLDLQKEIDSVITAVNASMSTYIPNSDISKINAGDSTVVVDAMFQDVFKLSKKVHLSTNGYFDPTVGVLVDAWGFGPGKQIQLDSVRVDSLMRFVGFSKVKLTENNTIRKSNSNIKFDFNAIAKGYAIDRLAVLMDANNIENYLLEVGGEVVAKGKNILSKRDWGVGVTDPQSKQTKKAIYLKNRAMASSGNYRKFRIDSVTGEKYVHTLNPITGYTKNGNILGVNILANNCAEADAYATAFMAMDVGDAILMLGKQKRLDAYIIYLNEIGETQEFMTEGFRASVIE